MVIYRDLDDFSQFVKLLGAVVLRFRWRRHAYCLMPNHYHLILESTRCDLSDGMHRLNGLYAQGFNDRYERSGHLFQNRFGARLIDDDRRLAPSAPTCSTTPSARGSPQPPKTGRGALPAKPRMTAAASEPA
jgi:putative transposase